MFLGIKPFVWSVMALCCAASFLYAFIENRASKNKKGKDLFSSSGYKAIGVCCLLAVIATVISKHETYIGSPMLSFILGIIIVNVVPEKYFSPEFFKGTTYSGKKFLNLGIITLGATLSFTDIFSAAYVLPLVIFNMALSFLIANFVGRKILKVSPNTATLVGGGTCVCGGTAIAALSPIIKAKEQETAYALTAIFLFDLLACISYPYLGMSLGFNETQFGFLAGTAINDTSSVIAAQETFAGLMGLEGYALPATIKVVRTSMIIVLALIFSVLTTKKEVGSLGENKASLGKTIWKAFPKFILFFLLTVALNTVLLNTGASSTSFYSSVFKPLFNNGYKFFVTVALAGVGFKIKFKDLFTKGIKPIILGGFTWFGLFCSSMIYACFIL